MTKTMPSISLNALLTAIFNRSYREDQLLYKNLDNIFNVNDCRNATSTEERDIVRETSFLSEYSVIEILQKAISLADYEDTIKFKRVFQNNALSAYSSLERLINAQMSFLHINGLDSWHKSNDENKHGHFWGWIYDFLIGEKYYNMRLFVLNSGNTKCFDTIHIGGNDKKTFKEMMRYILDKNICPDPHYKKIEVPDFVNPDPYNPRYIHSSARIGGFHYLVYLTASELKEIYEKEIDKDDLSYIDKAYWAYINACSEDKETKFFLFIN